jgi:integrase
MPRRANGAGSITWLGLSKVLLRVSENGRQRSKTVTLSRDRKHGGVGEAAAALEAFKAELEDEKAAPAKSEWTLRTLLDDYAASRARIGKSRATVESYGFVARRLTDEVGAVSLDDLTPDVIDDFYGVLAERGLSPTTIRHTHAVLVAAVNFAVEKQRVADNVVLRATPPDAKRKTIRRIEPEEADLMVRVAAAPRDAVVVVIDERPVRGDEDGALAIAIFLATYVGGRRGELCGLRWDDLDTEAKTLRFARQWVPGIGGQYLTDLKSETGAVEGARTVHLGDRTVALLERWRQLQGGPADGWIVSHDGHTPMRAKSLTEAIAQLGRKLGIKVSTHSFRRTADTQLVAAGVDVDTASRRQGHTKEVMLRHYVEGADDKAIAAASALEDRLVGQGMVLEDYFVRPAG